MNYNLSNTRVKGVRFMKKINNAFDFNLYLIDRYKDQYIPDVLSGIGGNISGSLYGRKFSILINPNSYATFTVSNNANFILEELIPILNEIMHNNLPICDYELLNKNTNNKEFITEWDIEDPEGRLEDIKSGLGYDSNYQILNLNIHKNPKIKTQHDNKQYGLYPAFLDIKTVDNLSEFEIFWYTTSLLNMYKKYDSSNSSEKKKDILYAIEYMVYQTKKLGLDILPPEENGHIKPTIEYIKWFNSWTNYLKLL